MKAVDFFCGAGGLTRGLLDAGIDVLCGIDVDDDCRKTYEENNAPARFLCEDIRTLSVNTVRNEIGEVDSSELLLAACAPCQPFSKHKRIPEVGDMSALLLHFGRFVEALLPGQILIENVPGLTKVKGNSSYRRFRRLLERLNYSVAEGVVDAKDYGVPQTRRRYILIGFLDRMATFPEPTHGRGRQQYATVRDAISGYPPITAGTSDKLVPNHSASRLSTLNLKRIRSCPVDGGDRRSWPKELVLDCHKNGHTGHTDVYGRMWWDKPAPALTCKCVSLSNGRYGHPKQHRAISLREAAALQSFDEDFIFYGPSRGHLAQQIGNSVPVVLAKLFGQHILSVRYSACPK